MALLLDWLIQPLSLGFASLLFGQFLLLWQGAASRFAWWVVSAGIFILWIASAPITANAFVRKLERLDDDATRMCSSVPGDSPIVVPGAGMDAYVESENPYEILSHNTLSRTLRAISLDDGRQTFYLLGGGRTERKLGDFMSLVLIDQGIQAKRIVAETTSLSTVENAREFALMVSPNDGLPIRLVTSHLHANRAHATFRAQGFKVCTIPVDPLYSVSAGWIGFLPYLDALAKSTHAWRELMATWLYHWRGFTATT